MLTKVASYSQPYEAHLARARLEEANIPAFIKNEHTIGANWLYSQALGGVVVEVPRDRLEEAKALLETSHPVLSMVDTMDEDRITCPRCGSADTRATTVRKIPVFIPLTLVAVFFIFMGEVWALLCIPLCFGGKGVFCGSCQQSSYTGNWTLQKIGMIVGIPSLLIFSVILFNGWKSGQDKGMSWQEMDWNQDGTTTLTELAETAFVIRRAANRERDCFEYYNQRTGRFLKKECRSAEVVN